MPDMPKHLGGPEPFDITVFLASEIDSIAQERRRLRTEIDRKQADLDVWFAATWLRRRYRNVLTALFWCMAPLSDHLRFAYLILAGKDPDPDAPKRPPFWKPQVGRKPPGGQISEPPKVKRGGRINLPKKPPLRD